MSRVTNKQTPNEGVLYVVATPIGNSDDISARAIRTLKHADLIACEDTRRTGQLLASHQIAAPTISYFEHNEERRVPEMIERMVAGAQVALVTDAGTPCVSDPGFRLVRAALDAGIRVVAVPGASAAIAALSVSGLPTDRFTFEGFLPPRDGSRRRALDALRAETRTMVFYEAARRLADTLDAMVAAFGDSRSGAVVREISKTYEETVRGTLLDLERRFRETPALGEITIVVAGAASATATASEGAPITIEVPVAVEALREAGLSLKQASAVVAKLSGRARREVYQDVLKSREDDDSTDD